MRLGRVESDPKKRVSKQSVRGLLPKLLAREVVGAELRAA